MNEIMDRQGTGDAEEADTLDRACRAALASRHGGALRWLPVDRYLAKASYTPEDARTLARHLMRCGTGTAYDGGVRILTALGGEDLEAIVPLHREAMDRHRARSLWNVAPSATWAGLAAMARTLKRGDIEACRLAERMERAAGSRCR